MTTRSSVVLSPTGVSILYSALIRDTYVPVTTCRANVNDIAAAKTVSLNGRSFLLLLMKPQRYAECDSGSKAIADEPVPNSATASGAVAAINRACCTRAVAQATAAPTHAPSARPSVSPSPIAVASPVQAPHLTDWVETQGLFAFIRVHNFNSRPMTVASGAVENCRGVGYGCGSFAKENITLQSGAAAILATVVASDAGTPATFTYRYTGESGATHFTGGGSSSKTSSGWRPPLTAQEVRAAEAVAIDGVHGRGLGAAPSGTLPASPLPAFVAARLVRRGSSSLAIGQKGTALVRVSVGANGMPQNATIVKVSNAQLVAAALETAVSSSYSPPMRDGRPVSGTYLATFTFDGEDPALSTIPVWRRNPTPAPSPTLARFLARRRLASGGTLALAGGSLWMNAHVVCGRFAELDVVVLRRFTNVGEGQIALGFGGAFDLVQARDRVTHVTRIGQRLFTLLRKSVDAIRKIALRRQPAMFLVRLPSSSHANILPQGRCCYAFRSHIERRISRRSTCSANPTTTCRSYGRRTYPLSRGRARSRFCRR